jgi:hypothetical protein
MKQGSHDCKVLHFRLVAKVIADTEMACLTVLIFWRGKVCPNANHSPRSESELHSIGSGIVAVCKQRLSAPALNPSMPHFHGDD